MLRFWIATSSLFVALCGADVDFKFGNDCFSKGGNLELTAEYTGSGTVSAVQWYYSGQVGINLVILASTCKTFGTVDAGYPDTSRMTFTCTTSNKFTLTLTDIQTDELDKSWGATFTLASGPSPTVAEKPIPVCPAPPAPSCKENCEIRVIVSIVFGILGIIALAGVVFGIVKDFSKPVCLAVAVLCIVFDIISLALSASVLADDDCKDCEDWILNSAIAFVVIPSIVAVTAIVLTILVLLGVIGPGRNGITKEDLRPWEEIVREKLLHELESAYPNILSVKDLIRKVDAEESVVMEQLEELRRRDLIRQLDSGGFVRHHLDVKTGGMNGGRGHGGGHGPNSNTVNSGRIDKHRGTLSDRANSDGEVSRKDVHVQENRDNFSGRPMPPIPLTDKKGRGLSANYDDDHAMISVATPDRRAGDLGPLDEKPRKKKKKKKKAVNDNDE